MSSKTQEFLLYTVLAIALVHGWSWLTGKDPSDVVGWVALGVAISALVRS